MKFISWFLVIMLTFILFSVQGSMQEEIDHLQEQLYVCRDWNNTFINLLTEQGDK